MQAKEKIWGQDLLVFSGNCVEIHLLKLRPCPITGAPTSCSLHTHSVKNNLFWVLKGEVGIVMNGTYTLLLENEMTEIFAGQEHMFIAAVPATVIEIVWANNITEDIHRKNEGRVLSMDEYYNLIGAA